MYLNTVEYGSNAYGIKSAAHTFFNKEPDELNVQEAAVLVGVVNAPTRYSPLRNYDNAVARRNLVLSRMAKAGATVIGVPCNTAHSPRIMDVAVAMLHEASPQTRFVHMIDAVVAFIRESLPHARTIGVLSTKGTYATGLYQDALSAAGFVPLFPDEEGRERVQQAISNTAYGIKAQSNPVTPEARGALLAEAEKLVEQGADAVILGCTEIPLALTEPDLRGVPLLDATKVLARALIIAFAPERLKKA